MKAYYPEFHVYDWTACQACGDGLMVEARANIRGVIRYHCHCFKCGKDDQGIIRRGEA